MAHYNLNQQLKEDIGAETLTFIAHKLWIASAFYEDHDVRGLYRMLRSIFVLIHAKFKPDTEKQVLGQLNDIRERLYTARTVQKKILQEEVSEIFDALEAIYIEFTAIPEVRDIIFGTNVDTGSLITRSSV